MKSKKYVLWGVYVPPNYVERLNKRHKEYIKTFGYVTRSEFMWRRAARPLSQEEVMEGREW